MTTRTRTLVRVLVLADGTVLGTESWEPNPNACICPCWGHTGCPFEADGPGRQCEPCAAHHPDYPNGEVVVGHLYSPDPFCPACLPLPFA